MAKEFHFMVKVVTLDHGHVRYQLTGVEYGHDGIKGLRHIVDLSTVKWTGENTSGTFSFAYAFDGGTSRIPILVTCAATGVAKLRTRFQLPPDFGSFPADGVNIFARRNAAITHLKATLLKAGAADSTINGVSINPASASVWEAFPLTPGDVYSPGDWLTLEIEFSADTIADAVEIADVTIEYVSGRGNQQ
jgi:hypothetical protein